MPASPAKSHPSDLPPTDQHRESEDQDQIEGEVELEGEEGEGEGGALAELEAEANYVDEMEEEEELEEDEEEEEEEEEVEVEAYESSSSASTSPSTLTWISWYVSLPGHEYFCEVAEDFIEDDFNLTGLQALVPFYKEAMEMVLDVEAEDETQRVPDVTIVESSAELLYGLIHQRFIITRQGLQQMYAKYDAGHFGQCPRVYCTASKLVPCGRSDLPGVDTVKLYCSSCVDMYVPPSSRFSKVDGAFFGTTFPHLLFQTYPSALPFPSPNPTTSPTPSTSATGEREETTSGTSLAKVYIPRIYGFKVSERAKSGPRMQWLRMRPRTEAELDWRSDDDLGMVDGAAGNGDATGGPTEKFDMDGPDDDDDSDEEEEEEEGGGGGGGGSKGSRMQMSGIVGTPPVNQASTTTVEEVRPLPSLPPTSSTITKPIAPLPPKSPSRTNSNSSPTRPPAASASYSPNPPRPISKDLDLLVKNVGLGGPTIEVPALARPPTARLVGQKV